MGDAEAKELGKFARTLARAELRDLLPIIASTLDDCVDLLRRTVPPALLIEMVAALSAELHKRNTPAVRAVLVGNA